jgi:hypothetical protein
MANSPSRWLAGAALCAAAAGAQAQGAPGPARPDPLDATVPVPAPVYRSVLALPRRADADAPVPWREANDLVGRIGGWRAYAREAQAPASPPAPVALPAAAPAPAPAAVPVLPAHHGHKTPRGAP